MEYEILKEFFSPCAGDMFPLSQEIIEQEVADPEQYVRDLFKNEKDPQFIVTKNGESLVVEARLVSEAKHRFTFTEI